MSICRWRKFKTFSNPGSDSALLSRAFPMSIRIECKSGHRLKVRDELAGWKVRCPQCQAVISVPIAEIGEDLIERADAPDPPHAPGSAAGLRSLCFSIASGMGLAALDATRPMDGGSIGAIGPFITFPTTRRIILRQGQVVAIG